MKRITQLSIHPLIYLSIYQGTSPGKRIGTIQANDIDSHPHLTYSYKLVGKQQEHENALATPIFNMDKFSGILSLGNFYF